MKQQACLRAGGEYGQSATKAEEILEHVRFRMGPAWLQDRGGGGGGGGWDKIVRNVGINLLFLAGYFILDGGGGGFFGGGCGGGGGILLSTS